MSAQEIIAVIVAGTGCIIALKGAWHAVQTLRDGRRVARVRRLTANWTGSSGSGAGRAP